MQFQREIPVCLLKTFSVEYGVPTAETTLSPAGLAPDAPSSAPTLEGCHGVPTGIAELIRNIDLQENFFANAQGGGQLTNCKGIEAYLWDDTNYSATGFCPTDISQDCPFPVTPDNAGQFPCNESMQMVDIYVEAFHVSRAYANLALSEFGCTMASVYVSMGMQEHFQVGRSDSGLEAACKPDCAAKPCTFTPTVSPTAKPTTSPTGSPTRTPTSPPSPLCSFNLQCTNVTGCWKLEPAAPDCACYTKDAINAALSSCGFDSTVSCSNEHQPELIVPAQDYARIVTDLLLLHQRCDSNRTGEDHCGEFGICHRSFPELCQETDGEGDSLLFRSFEACNAVATKLNTAMDKMETESSDTVMPAMCPCEDNVGIQILLDKRSFADPGFAAGVAVTEQTIANLSRIGLAGTVSLGLWAFDNALHRVVPDQATPEMVSSNHADFSDLIGSIGDRSASAGTTAQPGSILTAIRELGDAVLGGAMDEFSSRVLILIYDGETEEPCARVSYDQTNETLFPDNCVETEMQRFKDAGWSVVVVAMVNDAAPRRTREHLQRLTQPMDGGFWNEGNRSWHCPLPSGTCDHESQVSEALNCQTLSVHSWSRGAPRLGITEDMLRSIVDRARSDQMSQIECCPTNVPSAAPTATPTPAPTPAPTTLTPTEPPTCMEREIGLVNIGLQLLIDQSGSIPDDDLEESMRIMESTLTNILREDMIYANARVFDAESYAMVPDERLTDRPMPATTNRNDFDDMVGRINRGHNRGTATRRALRETADIVLNSDMDLLQAKVLILVTDGHTLEPCGFVDRVGTENCVETEVERFKDAGWAVVVIAVVANIHNQQETLEHLQRVTYPTDGGHWDAATNGWVCPSGVCEVTGSIGNTEFVDGTGQTLFLQTNNADPSAGVVSYALVRYALGLALDSSNGTACGGNQGTTFQPRTLVPTAAPVSEPSSTPRKRRQDAPECSNPESNCNNCRLDGRCEQCRNSALLHRGMCVESCPSGFDEQGRGRFNRRCIPATTPVPTVAVRADQGCVPRENHCHLCSTNGTRCEKCRDQHYLHEGSCHQSCPTGFNGLGNGRYSRACVATGSAGPGPLHSCTPREDHCHHCASDGRNCVQCRDSYHLHEGLCLQSCPLGSTPAGGGRYNRRCEGIRNDGGEENPPGSCASMAGHCHRCSDDGAACSQCRDQHYLHEGSCLESCPIGFDGLGIGHFSRRCTATAPITGGTAACTAMADHCHECSADRSQCEKCRDMHYLHQGRCTDSCPVGTTFVGSGNFNRRCAAIVDPEVPGAGCTPLLNHCHECSEDLASCSMCRDSHYLLPGGHCVEQCPDSLIPEGRGRFRRRCESDTVANCAFYSQPQPGTGTVRRRCVTCAAQTYLTPEGQCVADCGIVGLQRESQRVNGRVVYGQACSQYATSTTSPTQSPTTPSPSISPTASPTTSPTTTTPTAGPTMAPSMLALGRCLDQITCPYPTSIGAAAYPNGASLRAQYELGCDLAHRAVIFNLVETRLNSTGAHCDACHEACESESNAAAGPDIAVACHAGCDCYYHNHDVRRYIMPRGSEDCLLELHQASEGAKCVTCKNKKLLHGSRCIDCCPEGYKPKGRASDCLARECAAGDCGENTCTVERESSMMAAFAAMDASGSGDTP